MMPQESSIESSYIKCLGQVEKIELESVKQMKNADDIYKY
jgi:hypothetical protein